MTTTMSKEAGVWACPDSELVLPVTASREQWLAARRKGIGGSDLGGLMRVSPYTDPYQVWKSKTGEVVDIATKRMQRGTRFEAEIANEFAEENGLTIRRVGLHRSRRYPHMLASVDRASDDGGGVEIKWVQNYHTAKKLLAFDRDPEQDAELFPAHWSYQVLHYLAVTGRTHWWLAAMLPGRDELFVRRFDAIEYADQIARIGPAIEAWWEIHMDGGVMPSEGAPYNPADITPGKTIEAINPDRVLRDRERWEELKEQLAGGDLELEELKKRADAELGDAEILAVNGRPVFKRNHRAGANKFDRKKFKAEEPVLEAKYSTQGEPTSFISLA